MIKIIKKNIADLVYRPIVKKIFMYLCNKILGIDRNKIVFISLGGHSYSDNPKAISVKLYELDSDMKIIWLFLDPTKKKNIVPEYIKRIKVNTYKALIELATARIWVDNNPKPGYYYKSKKQIYVQTWHGDRGFKKVLYDARTKLPNGHYKEGDLIEPKACDLAISGSQYGNSIFRSAFGYSGEILKVGSPRADILIENSDVKKSKIKRQLEIPAKTKVLLYAPTFRDSIKNKKQNINFDWKEVIDSLENKSHDRWIFLVRAHSVSNGINLIENSLKIMDVTEYEDMADLLLITDFLITDYSSTVGDFILLKKPYVMYQADIENYKKNNREFNFDFKDSPYCIAYCQKDLIDLITNMNPNIARENAEALLAFYNTTETGKASEEVAKYIIEKVKSERR